MANVLRLALGNPVQDKSLIPSPKSAQGVVAEMLPQYRAAFIVHSVVRVNSAVRRREPLSAAMTRERRFLQQHLVATKRRVAVAKAVDKVAASTRRKVGWYATLDNRTSLECRAANGKNFYADRMPTIGYPGAVHPSCRCRPGVPHATKDMVYSVAARHAA